MALRDEIKAGRKDLMENGTFKEKLAYFFDYYTLHTVIVLVLLLGIGGYIIGLVTKPDIILNGLTLNVLNFTNNDPISEMNDAYMEHLGLDPKKNEMSINASLSYKMGSGQSVQYSDYEVSQAIMVQCAAGSVDFISAPQSAVIDYGYGQLFMNLEDVLSKEELERYKPYLLYVDLEVVREKDAAVDRDENPDMIPFPDPTKPEEMKEPIPIFINISEANYMKDIYSYTTETIVLGVSVKSPNQDNISSFLEFLFEEK